MLILPHSSSSRVTQERVVERLVSKATCYPHLTHVPASGYLFVFGAVAAAAWLFFAASLGWYAMAAYSTLSSSLTGFGGAEGFFGLMSTLAYTSPSGCYMWMEGGEKRERRGETGEDKRNGGKRGEESRGEQRREASREDI